MEYQVVTFMKLKDLFVKHYVSQVSVENCVHLLVLLLWLLCIGDCSSSQDFPRPRCSRQPSEGGARSSGGNSGPVL